MRHLSLLSVLLFATALTGPAAAQGPAQAPPDAASARADDLTHRGNDLALKHEWAEAAALFRQAWALKQSYDISGNLGIASFALGKYADAAEYVTFALKHFPANGKREHQELLREKLAKARAEIGARTIEVSVAGAQVFVDGKSMWYRPDAGRPSSWAPARTRSRPSWGLREGDAHVRRLQGELRQGPPRPARLPDAAARHPEGAEQGGHHRWRRSPAPRSSPGSCSWWSTEPSARCQLDEPGDPNRAGELRHRRLEPRSPLHPAQRHGAPRRHLPQRGRQVLIGAGAVAAGTAAYCIWSASTPTKTARLGGAHGLGDDRRGAVLGVVLAMLGLRGIVMSHRRCGGLGVPGARGGVARERVQHGLGRLLPAADQPRAGDGRRERRQQPGLLGRSDARRRRSSATTAACS